MTAPGARSPAAEGPPEALVTRFRQALERLWPEGGRLGLAVSGGPDSLAMLLLAQAALPGRFEVATVDHGLRPESAGECALVARICAERGIPCAVFQVAVRGGNLQAEARAARYHGLAKWATERELTAIATAHHADDQAETLLMRLNRGSGVSGLAGVREETNIPGSTLSLIRPLLGFRRAELEKIVHMAGLEPVIDPSNEDDRFDRVRVRKFLASADWIDPVAVARSASLLAEAQRAIEEMADEEWANAVFDEDGGFRYYPSAPSSYVMVEVVLAIISRMGGTARRSEVRRLIAQLFAGRAGNLAGVLVRPTVERHEDAPAAVQKWVFRPEPKRSVH